MERNRPAIGTSHGIGNHFVGIQLLEAHVAVGAHFHEHVFVVGRIEQLEQEVFRRDRHVVGADIDAGALHLLSACRHPCAAGIALEQIRRSTGVQPQHIGIERCGRCAAAIDLFGVIRRGTDLERDVIRVLGDAGFGVHHPGNHAVQILRRCAPCRPSVQHFQFDVPKLHRARHAVGTAGAQRKIRDTGGMKAGQVQRAVLHSYPIPVGSDKVRVR